MSDNRLQDNLDEILSQKTLYLIPNNIRNGVQIFDIVGTYGGGASTAGVKLFDSIANMQADPTAQEGDYATVYADYIENITATTEFDSCIFPSTVILSSAITNSISASFGAMTAILNATRYTFSRQTSFFSNNVCSIY